MVGRSRRLGRRVVAAGAVALAGLTAAAGPALAGPAPGSQVPPPTPGRLLLSWSLNPLVIVGLLAAAVAYLQGRRRLVADGIGWPARRTVYFLPGIAAIFLTLTATI